jgi:hypothetical protein
VSTFLLDLWHDLRAKRLWPVAALLAVALVAVPLVLKKHSSNSSTAAPAPTASASSDDKAVVVADTSTSRNSTLGLFNKKNPFKPDRAVLAAAHPKAPASPSPGGSAKQSTPAGGASESSGGSGTGGGSSAGGGGGGGGTPAASQPTHSVPTGPFAYTIDVRFGKRGHLRTHHDVQKLDVLPNQNNPLVVFLGVNTKGDTAVFLTDTSLKAAGEGSCKPSGDTCSFLYLKLRAGHDTEDLSEQAADGTGTEYTLKLLAIHKRPVTQLAKSAAKSARAARAAARRIRTLKHRDPTPFRVPLATHQLPDIVG